MASFALLGIGNNLLQDDGVGVHVVERFAKVDSNPDVSCIDGGTVGLALMDRLSGLDGLIVVDAMRFGKPAGTITLFQESDMDRCLRNRNGSAHEVGLSDLMDALRLSGALPARRALLGIEPQRIEWGTIPTPEVAEAIPRALEQIHALLHEWRQAQQTEDAA